MSMLSELKFDHKKFNAFNADEIFDDRLKNIINHVENNYKIHAAKISLSSLQNYPPRFLNKVRQTFADFNLENEYENFLASFTFTKIIVNMVSQIFVLTPQLMNHTPEDVVASSDGLIRTLRAFWEEQINASIREYGFSFKVHRFKDLQNNILQIAQNLTSAPSGVLAPDTLYLHTHEKIAATKRFLSPLEMRLQNSWNKFFADKVLNKKQQEEAYTDSQMVKTLVESFEKLFDPTKYAKMSTAIFDMDYTKCTTYNLFDQVCLIKLLLNYVIMSYTDNRDISPHLVALFEKLQAKIY